MQYIEHPMIKAYRELLNVGPKTSSDNLRKAYRSLAQIYHPDKNSDNDTSSVFMKIKEAYEILSNPKAMASLNHSYLNDKCMEKCIHELNLNFGSFFGHRFFTPSNLPVLPPNRLLGMGVASYTFEDTYKSYTVYNRLEGNRSILDDASLDFAELVFAGTLSQDDLDTLRTAFRKRDFSILPWYMINNEGIVHFLNRDYDGATITYEILNDRLSDNIIFLYRLGICYEIAAFNHSRLQLFGEKIPNRHFVKAAIRCFKQAIRVGESRVDTPQKCMTVRKTLADLLETIGRKRRALIMWHQIQEMEPSSTEARTRVNAAKHTFTGFLARNTQ